MIKLLIRFIQELLQTAMETVLVIFRDHFETGLPEKLGIDILWLSPVYESPMVDRDMYIRL